MRTGTHRWVLSVLRPYTARLVVLASLALAEIALRAAGPWPLKVVIDELVGSAAPAWLPVAQDRRTLVALVIAGGLLLQIGHQLVLLLHTRLQTRLAQRIVFDVRYGLFNHLQRLSLEHHQKSSAADAVYRLDSDATCLENLLLRGLLPMLFSALTLVVMFGLMIRIDATLALVSIAAVPVLYVGLRLYMPWIQPRAERVKALESAALKRMYESLSTIHLVKAFAREDHELRRFSGAAREAMQHRAAVTDSESLFSFIVNSVTIVASASVLGLGAAHVIGGQLTAGTLLVVIAYLGFVYGPLSAIATTAGSLPHALVSATRVRDVLALPGEDSGEGDLAPAARLRGDVQFDNVTFAYGPGTPVLSRISFSVEAGQTIALVGPSGAGKTTLVSLLARFHQPNAGCVLVDGVDVAKLKLKPLRDQIAVVPQEPVLTSGTIADNIRYGRLDATPAEVMRAAHAAGCDEFLARLPLGIDTPLNENGSGLSGGQRQRVALARAFLKDAPILILDEPTAALDTRSEQYVLDALSRLRTWRTTFVIAHRLSTVRDADRILVMETGRIVADGSHEELLDCSPLYRELCAKLDNSRATLEVDPVRPSIKRFAAS